MKIPTKSKTKLLNLRKQNITEEHQDMPNKKEEIGETERQGESRAITHACLSVRQSALHWVYNFSWSWSPSFSLATFFFFSFLSCSKLDRINTRIKVLLEPQWISMIQFGLPERFGVWRLLQLRETIKSHKQENKTDGLCFVSLFLRLDCFLKLKKASQSRNVLAYHTVS